MELRHLRYFVAVAEEENFHRAARKLHVSQPPLSRQVQQLKNELGVELFEGSGRGVRLTLAGRMFLERAKAILATVDAAVAEVRQTTTGRIGTVAIGFNPGAAYAGALSSIVTQYRQEQPRVNVRLVPMRSAEQFEALRSGEIALGYGNYVPDDRGLRSAVLSRARIGILLPRDHRLAAKPKLRVEDLAHESILMEPRQLHPRLHDDIIAAVRAHGVVLNLAPDVLDREALWALVASGLGLTFAGERAARFHEVGDAPGPQFGSAVWRPLTNLGVVLRDVATWRADAARSPLLRPLLDIVRRAPTARSGSR